MRMPAMGGLGIRMAANPSYSASISTVGPSGIQKINAIAASIKVAAIRDSYPANRHRILNRTLTEQYVSAVPCHSPRALAHIAPITHIQANTSGGCSSERSTEEVKMTLTWIRVVLSMVTTLTLFSTVLVIMAAGE